MPKILSVLVFLLTAWVASAQDSLLLNNGKYKALRGEVVYYDYNDILYQNALQKARMEADLEELKRQEEAMRNSPEWQAKQAAVAEKVEQKRLKKRAMLVEKVSSFKQELELRKTDMTDAAAFERWKSKQETDIKAMEQKIVLDSALQAQRSANDYEKKQGRIRQRHTRSVPRQQVFSILRADGSEEVVYNADTLGLLADGEFEKEYGVAEMRLYIKGRQDGRKHSFHDVYIGAATGLVSGILFTYFLDMFYAPIPPAIGVVILATRNNFKPNPKLEIDAALLNSEAYMDGYIQSAKGRKILAFTVGAIGGLGVGIGVGVATSTALQ